MTISTETMAAAADTLRGWALDEQLKAVVMANPALAAAAGRAARRYTAGPERADALNLLVNNRSRGHLGSVECVGESVRSAAIAERETAEIICLSQQLATFEHPPTVSFDLSHIGSVVSPETGLQNSLRIAQAARDAGTYVMISAEGSARTDGVLDLWERLSADFPETGITLQARLHRTSADIERVRRRPGPIRVVKGAFLEPVSTAYPRDSAPMYNAYRAMVTGLVQSGHRVNIATHDAVLLDQLRSELAGDLRSDHVEFETLQGLGSALLDSLHDDGFITREYIVYGPEWWLYVLNRLAEHPERVITAIADLHQ